MYVPFRKKNDIINIFIKLVVIISLLDLILLRQNIIIFLLYLLGDLIRMNEILDEDISQRDAWSQQDGATPLMFTAMMGRLDMVQLLVEKGCDVNKQDTVSGWTALMQATYHG